MRCLRLQRVLENQKVVSDEQRHQCWMAIPRSALLCQTVTTLELDRSADMGLDPRRRPCKQYGAARALRDVYSIVSPPAAKKKEKKEKQEEKQRPEWVLRRVWRRARDDRRTSFCASFLFSQQDTSSCVGCVACCF